MDIWTRLGGWFNRREAAPPMRLQPAFDDCADELPVEPERPWGCGWFDSSLDLRQGLAVIEHQAIDLGLALDLMLAPDGALH